MPNQYPTFLMLALLLPVPEDEREGQPFGGQTRKQKAAMVLRQASNPWVQEICEVLNISHATFHRCVSARNELGANDQPPERNP